MLYCSSRDISTPHYLNRDIGNDSPPFTFPISWIQSRRKYHLLKLFITLILWVLSSLKISVIVILVWICFHYFPVYLPLPSLFSKIHLLSNVWEVCVDIWMTLNFELSDGIGCGQGWMTVTLLQKMAAESPSLRVWSHCFPWMELILVTHLIPLTYRFVSTSWERYRFSGSPILEIHCAVTYTLPLAWQFAFFIRLHDPWDHRPPSFFTETTFLVSHVRNPMQ